MCISYVLHNALYWNITNRCTNNCAFCVRHTADGVGDAENLWLEKEPSRVELKKELRSRDLSQFNEVVFCGFGEPACRLDDMLWLCREIRKVSGIRIRLNTNGHASLIHKRDTAPEFEGLVDVVSVSLNAKNAEEYTALCKPSDGEASYYAMLDFAAAVKNYVPEVIFSVVDTMPPEDIEACRKLAEGMEIPLRIRHYTDKG